MSPHRAGARVCNARALTALVVAIVADLTGHHGARDAAAVAALALILAAVWLDGIAHRRGMRDLTAHRNTDHNEEI